MDRIYEFSASPMMYKGLESQRLCSFMAGAGHSYMWHSLVDLTQCVFQHEYAMWCIHINIYIHHDYLDISCLICTFDIIWQSWRDQQITSSNFNYWLGGTIQPGGTWLRTSRQFTAWCHTWQMCHIHHLIPTTTSRAFGGCRDFWHPPNQLTIGKFTMNEDGIFPYWSMHIFHLPCLVFEGVSFWNQTGKRHFLAREF